MAKRPRKDSSSIDGFTAFKAVRESHERARRARGDAPAPESAKPAAARGGVGRTALPTRHSIRCYECGYDFIVAGRVGNTGCPKCHVTLEAKDLVVDGEWKSTIKTIGRVLVKKDGAVVGGSMHANDLVVEGAIRGGDIYACGCLECRPGASIDMQFIRVRDLVVRPGGKLIYEKEIAFRNVDVEGELQANVVAEGLVRVRPGGFLRGSIRGAHLEIQEGGGLKATLQVEPSAAPEPPPEPPPPARARASSRAGSSGTRGATTGRSQASGRSSGTAARKK